MENWSDFWLNEGFTQFLEQKIRKKFMGEEVYKL